VTPANPQRATPDADDESARLARDRERDRARMIAQLETDRAKKGSTDG